MKNKAIILLSCILLLWVGEGLLTSCSTTANLPEGEQLYTGVSDISFGEKSKKVKKHEREGVITALNDAYKTVESVLSGQGLKEKTLDMDDLTKWERDSIKDALARQEEALATTKEEVTAVLSIAPNNSFLGSAKYRFPLPIGLWVYNRYVGSQSKFGKWMFNTLAATPKLISTVNPSLRAKVAQNVLHNYGYFRGEVSYDVLTQKNPRKAKIAYTVLPHQLYRLDSISIQYFPHEADSLIKAHQSETLLKKGNPFTAASLDAERNRLNSLFRDKGFYYCQPTFFTYRADTLARKDWVQLQIRPSLELPMTTGRRYYIRKTNIHLVDKLRGTVETDSLGRRDVKMYYIGKGDKRKPSVRFGLLRRQITYNKGDLYSATTAEEVQNALSNLGIFSQVSMSYTPVDSTRQNSLTSIQPQGSSSEQKLDKQSIQRLDSLFHQHNDSLDVDIFAVLDKSYDAEFKANATTKSNNFIGPQLSWSMTKRNAFHGAEALNFNIYGSYEWQTGSNQQGDKSVMNSYEYGTSLSLDYPYLKLGKLGRKIGRRATTSTSFKLEADWLNRANYFGRVTFGARVNLTYQRKATVRHEFTPFRLDYDVQLHRTAAFDSILDANQALSVSMRNQFVPSMQYALYMTSDASARNPRSLTITLKEAGNITSGIYSCFGSKFKTRDKNLFGVPFAQYIKAVVEATDKIKLGGSDAYLAGRVLLGAVCSYGNATIAPYSDLFTVGGANSIRAFAIRSIGPGSYHPANSKYSYVDQVGDLKFEANLECRFPIVGSLNGAVFVDCGNVWLMRNNDDHPGAAFKWKNLGKELALGTGFGLRYDLDFIVVRFDLGIGIHAPYDTGKSGYYNMTKFGKSLGYHLAIGYPF